MAITNGSARENEDLHGQPWKIAHYVLFYRVEMRCTAHKAPVYDPAAANVSYHAR